MASTGEEASIRLIVAPEAPLAVNTAAPRGAIATTQVAYAPLLQTVQEKCRLIGAAIRKRRRGRPPGTGTFTDGAEFAACVRKAVHELRLTSRRRPRQRDVARYLTSNDFSATAHQLGRWCKQYGYDWKDLLTP